jgi:hypothetical protein
MGRGHVRGTGNESEVERDAPIHRKSSEVPREVRTEFRDIPSVAGSVASRGLWR